MEPSSDQSASTQAGLLAAQLAAEIRRYHQRATFGMLAMPLGAGLTFLVIAALYMTLLHSLYFFLPALLLWMGWTATTIDYFLRPRPEYRQTIQALADLEDVRAIGPLIDTLQIDHAVVHQITVPALITLLPRLRPKDADLLNKEQRERLTRILSRVPTESVRECGGPIPKRPVALRIAILQGFTQIGDNRIRPEVEAWVRRKPRIAGHQEIRDAAVKCLAVLDLRAEQRHSAQTLLRASSATPSPDTLLRPTSGVPETPPEQLLRPESAP